MDKFNLETTEPDDFNLFWPEHSKQGYPKKQGSRKKAKAKWGRLSEQDRITILADFKPRYEGTDRLYIPYPLSYLNGEFWKCEIEKPEVKMPRTNEEWEDAGKSLDPPLLPRVRESWPEFKTRISAAMRS